MPSQPSKDFQTDILLIEDNHADIELVQEWLDEMKLPRQMKCLSNSQEVFEYFEDHLNEKDSFLPRLILLDINLPGVNGIDILAKLKADDRFKKIPVVMLTSSTAPDDIARCYSFHANAYVKKHMDLNSMYVSLSSIHSFWFDTAQLPA